MAGKPQVYHFLFDSVLCTRFQNRFNLTFLLSGFQVWRALRLIVDTGLHYVGFTREKALEYFSKYAWDDTDLARKEVRHT